MISWRRAGLLVVMVAAARSGRAQSAALAAVCNASAIPAGPGTPDDFRTQTKSLRNVGAGGDVNLPALVVRLRQQLEAQRPALTVEQYAAIDRHLGQLLELPVRSTPPDFDLLPRATRPNANGSYVLFAGVPDSIMVWDQTSGSAQRAVCYTALEAQDLISDFMLPERAALDKALRARVERWNSFHDNGYSQFIVELAVNSWFGFPRGPLEPPTRQWIVLHPSVGAETPLPFRRGVDGRDAMLLEAIGIVQYFNDEKSYAGLSAGSVFGAGEKPGLALVAHYGSLGHVGFVYRGGNARTAELGNSLLFSVDLLKAVNAMPASWKLDAATARALLDSCLAHLSCQ